MSEGVSDTNHCIVLSSSLHTQNAISKAKENVNFLLLLLLLSGDLCSVEFHLFVICRCLASFVVVCPLGRRFAQFFYTFFCRLPSFVSVWHLFGVV